MASSSSTWPRPQRRGVTSSATWSWSRKGAGGAAVAAALLLGLQAGVGGVVGAPGEVGRANRYRQSAGGGASTAGGVPGATDAARQAYGHLWLSGASKSTEVFRATFGGYFPCDTADVLLLPVVAPPVDGVADDGSQAQQVNATAAFASDAALACTAPPPGEAAAWRGKVVVAQRGNCSFAVKATVAQAAGARAILVVNNDIGLLRVASGNVTLPFPVTILVGMLPHSLSVTLERAYRLHAPLSALFEPVRDVCVPAAEAEVEWNETVAIPPPPPPPPADPVATPTAAAVIEPAGGSPLFVPPARDVAYESPEAAAAAAAAAAEAAAAAAEAAAAVAAAAAAAAAAAEGGSNGGAGGEAAAVPSPLPLPTTTTLRTARMWNTTAAPPPAAIVADAVGGTGAGRTALGSEAARLTLTNAAPGALPFVYDGVMEATPAAFSGALLRVARPLATALPADACAGNTTVLVGADGHAAPPDAYVVVRRGGCPMIAKARAVQGAGAAGLIIVNAAPEGGVSDEVAAAAAAAAAAAGSDDLDASLAALSPAAAVAGFATLAAVGDTAADGTDVHIAVVMVGALPGAALLAAAAAAPAPASATPGGGVYGELAAAAGSAGVWDELEGLVPGKAGATRETVWGGDAYHLAQRARELVAGHHPAAGGGSRTRWAVVRRLGAAAGGDVPAALADAQRDSIGSNGKLATGGAPPVSPTARHLLHAPALTTSAAGALYLSQHAPAAMLRHDEVNPVWACRSDGGSSHYTVKLVAEVDLSYTATHAHQRRVADLLAQAACLEKVALQNAAALGSYLALLRADTPRQEWPRVVSTLLRPWYWPAADANAAVDTYIDIAARFTALTSGAVAGDRATVAAFANATLPPGLAHSPQ